MANKWKVVLFGKCMEASSGFRDLASFLDKTFFIHSKSWCFRWGVKTTILYMNPTQYKWWIDDNYSILVDQRIVCSHPYQPGSVQFVTLFQRIHIWLEWQHLRVLIHLLDWHSGLKHRKKKEKRKKLSKKNNEYLPQNFCCS